MTVPMHERLAVALRERYLIERKPDGSLALLGRGGTATVFLAHDLRHDRPVALKVVHPELAASVGTGRFLREIGKNLYAWSYAHAVRIDKDDNIWVVDKGSDMILKFNPEGHVEWVFGRKGEASHFMVPPDYTVKDTGIRRMVERELLDKKDDSSRR